MFYLIATFSIIIDLTSKNIAKSFLLNNQINLIYDILVLKLIKNTGIAFNIPLEWIFLKIVTIILISAITFYYFRFEKKTISNKLAFWLIIGWAIGNWWERVFNWVVIDFISVKYFAIFNFADIFINIWVLILIISYFLKNKN